MTETPYPGMGPAAGGGNASCLVMNPRNREASAARRARLLAGFDSLPPDTRADLLEAAETMAHRAGGVDAERDEARRIITLMYVTAGWEMPARLPAADRDTEAMPWRLAWHGGEGWRAWAGREAAARDFADFPERPCAVYRRADDGTWYRTELHRQA